MLAREAKRKLRSHIKAEISKLSPENINAQSERALIKLLRHEKFQAAKSIALYMSMPQEVQTLKMIEQCFKLQKNVYLPRCIPIQQHGRKKNHLDMLKVPNFQQVLELQPLGPYKLLEPDSGEDVMDTGDLDVVIVPGVAFTDQMTRLGHGVGFYDEFLTAYTKKFNKTPYLIGLALNEQIVHQIPTEPHDWKLDYVVCDHSLH